MMAGIEDRRYTNYYIEETVLERCGLLDLNKFKSFHDRLKAKYDSTKRL